MLTPVDLRYSRLIVRGEAQGRLQHMTIHHNRYSTCTTKLFPQLPEHFDDCIYDYTYDLESEIIPILGIIEQIRQISNSVECPIDVGITITIAIRSSYSFSHPRECPGRFQHITVFDSRERVPSWLVGWSGIEEVQQCLR